MLLEAELWKSDIVKKHVEVINNVMIIRVKPWAHGSWPVQAGSG